MFRNDFLGKCKTICMWIICLIGAYVFLGASPLHPFRGEDTLTDSSVFKTVAMMMQKGYMPYRDSFDHKGPLIYFINYLGNCISAYRGVFVIELLMLTVTFAFWYKLARLVCENAILSAISACCGIYLCYGYFEGGNFTEEYALLFISISLYIFVEYLLLDAEANKKLYLKITICGFCMGAVCMLRINMIAVWIVFCVAIAIRTLINKNLGLFVRFIACFLIGTLICVLPFCTWLAVNGCFGDFIDVYLGFNMMYSKSGTGMGTTMGKVKTFFTFANQNLYLAGIGVCLVIVGKWKKSQLSKVTKLTFFAMTYFVYMIVNLATESMSGVVFGHYGMISAPAVVLPIAILFGICNGDVSLELLELKHTCVGSDNFEIKEERRGRNAGVILLALFLVCYVMAGRFMNCVSDLAGYAENRNKDNHSEIIKTIRDVILTNSSAEDKISAYGNNDLIYVITNRVHATRYSYQYPIGDVNGEILEEYFEELSNELPKLIVVCPGRFDERINAFLAEYDYEMIYSENSEDSNLGYSMYMNR